MSFTFRNLFSEEDGVPGSDPERKNGERDGPTESGRGFGSPSEGAEQKQATQTFLVSELLAFIPPAISAQSGIPMEKEVAIPMTPGKGNDVSLSTIYQICPELFAAEITPLNDSTVTLPPKLGLAEAVAAGGESSLSASAMKAASSGFSPASEDSTPRQGTSSSAGAPSDNPFWSPQSDDTGKISSPSQVSGSGGPPEGAEPKSAAEIFSGFSGASNPFGSAPSAEGEETSSKEEPANFEAKIPEGFGQMLGGNPREERKEKATEETSDKNAGSGGDDAEAGSAFDSTPPAFAENPFDSSEGFTTLFSKQAEDDSNIPFPGGDSDQAAPPAEGWGALFQNEKKPTDSADRAKNSPPGLGEMLQESEAVEEPSIEVEETPAAMEDPLAGFGQGFQAFVPGGSLPSEPEAGPPDLAPEEQPPSLESEAEEKVAPDESHQENGSPAPLKNDGFSAWGPPAEVEVADTSVPETPSSSGPKPKNAVNAGFQAFVPASDAPEKKVEKPPVPEAKTDPVSLPDEEEVASPSESLSPVDRSVSVSVDLSKVEKAAAKPSLEVEEKKAPSKPVSSPPSVSLPMAGEESDESLRDLELRAIFLTDEAFTLAKVARRVVAMSGILGCALATPTRIVQASRNEASRLGDEAKEMVDTIRSLAKLTGLPEAKSFTLHTDKGTVSIFLEGDCCLTVNHEADAFSPGVRERLILIARSIHRLTE